MARNEIVGITPTSQKPTFYEHVTVVKVFFVFSFSVLLLLAVV